MLGRLREEAEHLVLLAPPRYRLLFPDVDAWLDLDGPDGARVLTGAADLRAVDLGVAWSPTAAEGLGACGVRRLLVGRPHPEPGARVHDHLWEPLRPRFGPRDRDPAVRPPEQAVRQIAERLGGRRPVVLSPGSGGARKRWPLARWRAVASAVPDPLWVGGPLEAGEAGWGTPRWDDLDLAGLAALASLCRCWLAPDSGPAHLAAASGAAVGVVFVGATDPRTWAPPGARVLAAEASPDEVAAWARGSDSAKHP